MELLHKLSGTILWLPTSSGNNDVALVMKLSVTKLKKLVQLKTGVIAALNTQTN